MLTSFSAITWNSSRTYSLVNSRVSMTISLISLAFRPHLIAVLQPLRRSEDHVLAAHQAFLDPHSLAAGRACFHGATHGLAIQHHEHGAVADGGRRRDHHRLLWSGAGHFRLLVR